MREGCRLHKRNKKLEKQIPQQIPVPVIPDDNTKQCSTCMEYKTLDNYYLSHSGKPVKMCKVCYKKYHRDKVEHKFKENGGKDHYYKDPDRYTTQEQRDQVFMVMETLSWTYKDGVWFKKGIKELIDGNIVWPNITPTVKKERKTRQTNMGRKIKSGVWNNTDKIVKFIEEGYTYFDVADIFDCSHTTIRTVVSRYRNEKKP
jgi:transposase